jgi:hypothetical protein
MRRSSARAGRGTLSDRPMPPIDRLVTTRLQRLDPRARRGLFRAVQRAEAAVQLFHRHRPGGRPVPHPIALTPFVVPRRLVPTLARLADCVHRFQAEAPRLYHLDAPGFRACCPLREPSRRWLDARAARPRPWTLMIRPDVGLDAVATAPGGARPVLFETNATALAGLYNHAAGVEILEAEVFRRLLAPAERRRLRRPPDLLALTVRWVVRAARRLGCRGALGVAFLEDAGPVAGYSEIPRLMRAFRARGVRVAHGTPGDLTVRRGAVYLKGVRVDIAYRDLGYDDVGPPPGDGDRRLTGFRLLGERGAIVPGFAGEFGHKGLLECLTDPAYAYLFTPAERRLLAACVPWTRVLAPRLTTDPAGRCVDLPELVRRDRARLLIKPNVGSSGEGVLLGAEVTAARWERRIDRALREPGAWVVQERRPGTRREMAYLRNGAAYTGPCFASLGLFYAPGDLGLHCRVSRAPVVNVARGGALACAFLSD